MRTLTKFSFILLAAGCASLPAVPEQPAGAGTYKLLAVENMALPEVIDYGPQAGEEIVGGQLILKKDGTFEMRIDARAQLTALEPLPYSRAMTGTYTSSNAGVTLTSARDNTTQVGALIDRTLRVYRGGVEYLFIR